MTTHEILKAASEYSGITKEEITSRNRHSNIIEIRQFISKLSTTFGATNEDIGVVLNVDHSTISEALRRFHYRYDHNKDYHDSYEEFKQLACPTHLLDRIKNVFPGMRELTVMSVSELNQVRQRIMIYDDELKYLIRKSIQR